MSLTDTTATTRAVSAGIDWSEADHAVCIVDGDGEPIERVTVAHSKAGIARLVAVLARHQVQAVGIERPDGPVVDALLAAALTVYVIAPAQIKALRRRYGTAGNKDDLLNLPRNHHLSMQTHRREAVVSHQIPRRRRTGDSTRYCRIDLYWIKSAALRAALRSTASPGQAARLPSAPGRKPRGRTPPLRPAVSDLNASPMPGPRTGQGQNRCLRRGRSRSRQVPRLPSSQDKPSRPGPEPPSVSDARAATSGAAAPAPTRVASLTSIHCCDRCTGTPSRSMRGAGPALTAPGRCPDWSSSGGSR
jgi:hypothetical protein